MLKPPLVSPTYANDPQWPVTNYSTRETKWVRGYAGSGRYGTTALRNANGDVQTHKRVGD
jgi:hypothetical protein